MHLSCFSLHYSLLPTFSIGLDTCLAIQQTLYTGTGDSKYRPSVLLERMVDAGWLGRKNGKGFYEYDD
jgi:3-hydroxybutyryl-CoA dehydrogenase